MLIVREGLCRPFEIELTVIHFLDNLVLIVLVPIFSGVVSELHSEIRGYHSDSKFFYCEGHEPFSHEFIDDETIWVMLGSHLMDVFYCSLSFLFFPSIHPLPNSFLLEVSRVHAFRCTYWLLVCLPILILSGRIPHSRRRVLLLLVNLIVIKIVILIVVIISNLNSLSSASSCIGLSYTAALISCTSWWLIHLNFLIFKFLN